MKKNTTKATKSPAPATKKPFAKRTAAAGQIVPADVTPAEVAAAEVTPAVVTKLVAAVAAPKPVAVKAATTTITAVYDVGFGNGLYIRGQGPGLSWDRGVLLTCLAPNAWQITLGESARPFTFKLLINDTTWCVGPDFTVAAGSDTTVTPEFSS